LIAATKQMQRLGCIEIEQYHGGCGGRLNRKTVIIVGLRCKVIVSCERCFEKLNFEGEHKGAHE
jgi:hypothetical protein